MTALANENGTVAERYAYDPWGRRRNPDNWELADMRTAFIVNRGYTMHEHLDQFGIINMNGRLYDPLTAQFFSPDPYIQAPGNWLNYNRYSYCLNNPFKYTDPTGEIVWFVPVIIGAAVGGVINVAIHWNQIDNFGEGLAAFGIGAAGGALAAVTGGAALGAFGAAAGAGGFIGGAVAGGMGYAYGTLTTSIGNNIAFGDAMPTMGQFLGGMGLAMLTGGTINGIVSAANGGNFLMGPKAPQPILPKPTLPEIQKPQVESPNLTETANRMGNRVMDMPEMQASTPTANSPRMLKMPSTPTERELGVVLNTKGTGNELYNFGAEAAKHMTEQGRRVPLQIMDDVIKTIPGLPDPGGSNALMHYSPLWKNGIQYQLEILYNQPTNSIWHFKYYHIK